VRIKQGFFGDKIKLYVRFLFITEGIKKGIVLSENIAQLLDIAFSICIRYLDA